jgi:hypothetical protein
MPLPVLAVKASLAASAVVLTPDGAFMGDALAAFTVAAAEFKLVLLYKDIMVFCSY